jgi:hypothetical protein
LLVATIGLVGLLAVSVGSPQIPREAATVEHSAPMVRGIDAEGFQEFHPGIRPLVRRLLASQERGGLGLHRLRSPQEGARFAAGVPTTDLDDDGLSDILTIELGDEDQVVARRGIDAAPIYRITAPPSPDPGPRVFLPFQQCYERSVSTLALWDVTGDGVSDVTFIRVDADLDPCATTDIGSIGLTVASFDGKSGEGLSSRTVSGSMWRVSTEHASVVRLDDYPVSFDVAHHPSGSQMLIRSVDGVEVSSEGDTHWVAGSRTTATVWSASDDEDRGKLWVEVEANIPDIFFSDRWDPEGNPDLIVWYQGDDASVVSRMALSGGELWKVSVPGSYQFAFTFPFTGPNSDLVFYDWIHGEVRSVHSLDDGAHVWTLTPDDGTHRVVKDMNGDGGYDFVSVEGGLDEVTARFVSGADLSEIVSSTHPSPISAPDEGVWHLAGDLDGDGIEDLVVWKGEEDDFHCFHPDPQPWARSDSMTAAAYIAISGGTGQTLWSRVGTGCDIYSRVPLLGDLDGEPGDDLYSYDGGDTVRVTDGLNHDLILEVTVDPEGSDPWLQAWVGELLGPGIPALVVNRVATRPVISAYRVDGSALWQLAY